MPSNEDVIPELKREDLTRILQKYLASLNRVYETKNGGEKQLAEVIFDDGEQKCNLPILPARRFSMTEEIKDPETGITMTIGIDMVFSHVNAVQKKVINLSGH